MPVIFDLADTPIPVPVDILVDEDGLRFLRRVNLYAITVVAPDPDAPL